MNGESIDSDGASSEDIVNGENYDCDGNNTEDIVNGGYKDSDTTNTVNIVNGDNDSSSNTRNGNPEDVLDKLSNLEVSSDKGLSNKSLKGVTFSPEVIKNLKYVLKIDTIFLPKKVTYVQWLKIFHPDHLPSRK